MFEEKYSGSALNMRKSLILDNFDQLRQLTNMHLENKLKTNTQEIQELNEEDVESVEEKKAESKVHVKQQDKRIYKKYQYTKNELASMSDQILT